MKLICTGLLIFGPLLTLTACLKLPTPSPTVLIVNHLNYLRYDHPANPTSLLPNGYPFYETAHLNAHLNRSFNENAYSLNRSANALNGLINLDELDNQLSGRLDQQLNNELNDRLNSHLPGQQADRPAEADQLDGQAGLAANATRPAMQAESIENGQSNDVNNNQILYSNEEIDRQLNHLRISDQRDDLILSNHTEHQARLLELDLLQQNEPALSLLLDADSPFLNSVQVSLLFSCCRTR